MDTGLRKDSRDIKQPGFDKIAMRCNEKIALRWRLTGDSDESDNWWKSRFEKTMTGLPYGGGLTGYSDEESEDDKDSENDDEIA